MFNRRKKVENKDAPVKLKYHGEPKGDLRKLTHVYALRVKGNMCDVHAAIFLGVHDDTRNMYAEFLLMASKLEMHRTELSEKTVDEITQLDLTGCDYIIFKARLI